LSESKWNQAVPITSALRRLQQWGDCEFKASLKILCQTRTATTQMESLVPALPKKWCYVLVSMCCGPVSRVLAFTGQGTGS
jgi:hypothetical protein